VCRFIWSVVDTKINVSFLKREAADYAEASTGKQGGIYVPLFALADEERRIFFGWADGCGEISTLYFNLLFKKIA